MRLPYGVRCMHCMHFSKCEAMFGVKPMNETCEWFPRKFIPKQYGEGKDDAESSASTSPQGGGGDPR